MTLEITQVDRTFRTAGIAAIAAAGFYILQPILVFLLVGDRPMPVDRETLGAIKFQAPYELVTFVGIGTATLYAVLAVHALMGNAGTRTISSSVTTVFGIVAVIGWFGAAAGIIQLFGLTLNNLPDTTDAAEQRLIIATGYTVLSTLLNFALIGSTGWLVGLALAGRRALIVGWPLAIIALVAAAVIGLLGLVLQLPFGMVVLIPTLLVLGIGFLLKSRARA